MAERVVRMATRSRRTKSPPKKRPASWYRVRQISHPGRIRRLQGMNTRHAVIDSPLNELTLVAGDDALAGGYYRHHWHRPAEDTFGPRVDADSATLLAEARNQL